MSTPQADAINRVAKRVGVLLLAARWVTRTMPSWIVMSVGSAFVLMGVNAFLKPPIDPIILAFGMLASFFPVLCIWIWFVEEWKRFRKALPELKYVSVPECNDVRQIVPPAKISLLLDVMAAAPIAPYEQFAYEDVEATAGLLSALLRSVQAEDEVTLTEFQRKLLHEFVITTRSFRDNWHIGAKGMYGTNTQIFDQICRELRPDAIRALGVLGNRSSLTLLERFAKTTDNPDLRQAALLSAEQIRDRLKYGSEQMLRASEMPRSPDTLLRAVVSDGTHQSDPQQLLRADLTDPERQF